MQYIPNVAKGIGTSRELKDLEAKMKDLQQQIALLKSQKLGHMQQLQQNKDKILKEIKDLRERINSHLDRMERSLLEEINTLIDQRMKDFGTSVNACDDIKLQVDKKKKSLQQAKNLSEAELFVQLKEGSSNVKENVNILKDLVTKGDERFLQFYSSKELERFMRDGTPIGHISYSMRPRSALHVGDFDVSAVSDKELCHITDVCLLDNGDIVIADNTNKRLKKLSNTLAVTVHVDLPDSPSKLCTVDSHQFAVTLVNYKKVQFVSQKSLVSGASFAVGDRCRGIACHNSFLYVCCGGCKTYKEGPGHIEVYSLTGELKWSITNGLQYPVFLHHLDARNELIVSEYFSVSPYKSRLVLIDFYDHSVSVINTDKLVGPIGFCMVGNDHLCITGYDSNNVVLVSKDGQVQQELLTKKSGLNKPYAVCFDEKQKRIIITSQHSNTIKLLRLEM